MGSEFVFDCKKIREIIPHRYPFLLVDRIVELDTENGIVVGLKNLSINEPFFQGHFPDVPLMPGVLILEALAQAGAVLVHEKTDSKKLGVLLSINRAKFRKPARPGDQLFLRCEGVHFSATGGKVKAVATVDGKMAAQAELGFAFVDPSTI